MRNDNLDLDKLRREFDVPILTPKGLVLDLELPYHHWRDLKAQAIELDQVTAYVPREANVGIGWYNKSFKKYETFSVPKLSEVRFDRDRYINQLEEENERLRRRLGEDI